MHRMQSATVVSLTSRRDRSRRMARAMAARQTLEKGARPSRRRTGGRAWLNGVPLGDRREALAHLDESYD